MKRLIACFIIAGSILLLTLFCTSTMNHFLQRSTALLQQSQTLVQLQNTDTALPLLKESIQLCQKTRGRMTLLLRIEDFTELENSLRSALAFLECDTYDEAYSQLCSAEVHLEKLERLTHRFL